MKIYTKTGDKGTTGLLTGERVDKDSLRVEAYGTVDEVNSALGLARAWCKDSEVNAVIYDLQKTLMLVMADLASLNNEKNYITAEHVKTLEQLIDSFDEKLPPLKEFLIPGGNVGAAALDLARTTTRRAERQVIRLAKAESINDHVSILLNRLSDLCFTLGRADLQQSK